MKIENAEIGMQVQVKKNIMRSLERFCVGCCIATIDEYIRTPEQTGNIITIEAKGVIICVDIDGAILNYSPSDLRIADKKKPIKVKKPAQKKDWPDTFEDAMKISHFWGLFSDNMRFIVCPSGPARGFTVSARGTWAGKEKMDLYWKGDGLIGANKYCFKPFESAEELYQWMSEGEE